MADETKQVDVIMGPYRGSRLTMSAADAQAAVNGHWATDPTDTDHSPDDPHPPLDDAERQAAFDAAHAWAKATWDAAQGTASPPEPPPEGGVTRKREMEAEKGEGYRTRQHEPKK